MIDDDEAEGTGGDQLDPLKLLESLPDDEDGFNYWYWTIHCEPLGFEVTVWKSEFENWKKHLHGAKVRHKADGVLTAVLICLEDLRKRGHLK